MAIPQEKDKDTSHSYTPEKVQDEFLIDVINIVAHWVRAGKFPNECDPLIGKLSGMVTSFYTSAAIGYGGGVNDRIQMRVYGTKEAAEINIATGKNFFPVEAEQSVDINDGTLSYHRADERIPEPVEAEGDSPREWTLEEMKTMYLNRVVDFIETWAAKENMSGIDKGVGVFHSIFTLCEGDDPYFPARIDLIFGETNLSTCERTLLQTWAHWDNHFFAVYRSHPFLTDKAK